MLEARVQIDTKSLEQDLDDVQRKQLPFATSLAINRTAQRVKAAEEAEVKRVFDRPTSRTTRGLFMQSGSKAKPEARVFLKDNQAGSGTPAAKFLLPQIEAGGRDQKRFEVALKAVGILKAGWYVVPGDHAEIDAYGNIKASQIRHILSYFRAAEMVAGSTQNMTPDKTAKLRKGSKKRRGFEYVVAQPAYQRTMGADRTSHLLPGIYRKTFFGFGTALQPVFIFVRSVRYRQRLDFHGVAERVIAKHIQSEFASAMAAALRTAR